MGKKDSEVKKVMLIFCIAIVTGAGSIIGTMLGLALAQKSVKTAKIVTYKVKTKFRDLNKRLQGPKVVIEKEPKDGCHTTIDV